jgi:hypothetical protein
MKKILFFSSSVTNPFQIQKVLSFGTVVLSLLTAIGSAAIYILSQIHSIAQQEVNMHDHGYPTQSLEKEKHPDLVTKILVLEKKLEDTSSNQVNQSDLVEAYWFLIGYIAADYESNPKLKAAAASYYRSVFREQLEICTMNCKPNGRPYIRDAFRAALNTPWDERSLLVRQLH